MLTFKDNSLDSSSIQINEKTLTELFWGTNLS